MDRDTAASTSHGDTSVRLFSNAIVAPGVMCTPPASPPLGCFRMFASAKETYISAADIVSKEDALYEDLFDDVNDGGPLTSAAFSKYQEDFSKMTNKELDDGASLPGWNLIHSPPRKFPRGALVGKVVSDKMQKTVNVAVDRYRIVPKYRKRLKYTRKFMSHDENELCSMGDVVMIVPCQKISRHKHFMVKEIIRAKGVL